MNYYLPDLAEVITSQQRDNEQINKLIQKFSECFRALFGELKWIRFYAHFPVICRLIYYFLTTFIGLQTIGEEYAAILPVVRKIDGCIGQMSLIQRSIFLVLECLTKKWQEVLHLFSASGCLLHLLRALDLSGLYQAFCFAFSMRYCLPSMKAVGISYISLRAQQSSIPKYVYEFVGLTSLIQRILFINFMFENAKKYEHTEIDNKNSKVPLLNFQCPLCCENKVPACAPCGHSFCWSCLYEYSSSNGFIDADGICPNCRTHFPFNRVISLLNF